MPNNIKTVMVTGGAGYIGSHTAYALIEAGWNVVVVDDLSTGLQRLVPQEAAFYPVSIADTDSIQEIIQEHSICSIMHFAGSIIVPESVEQPLAYYQNNTANTLQLIQAALSVLNPIKAFLFSSSAAVYGLCDDQLINEECRLNPINPYGTSKLMTEYMLRDAYAAHGLTYGILRYFNVAGADAKGRTGQYSAKSTHLIKIVAEAMTGKRDFVSINGNDYSTPDGTCVRDYIHVSDLADAHVLALEYILETQTPLVANCGYGVGYSVQDVINAAQKIANFKAVLAPRRAGDPPQLVANNVRIKEVLGWQPQHQNLPAMIESAVVWEEQLASA